MRQTMRITFIMPSLNATGGSRIIFEYADRLRRRGHTVRIYYPLIPYRFNDNLLTPAGARRWLGDLRLSLRRGGRVEWMQVETTPKLVPLISPKLIDDADAVIATAWPTAYSVSRLPARCGARFYFVQGYERWSGPADAVDGSYRLPLSKIVIASWLRDLLSQQFGKPVVATISNGVDTTVFYPEPAIEPDPNQVLMQYSHLPLKGFGDLMAAWPAVLAACPNARLVLFGLERGADVPDGVEFYRSPSRSELRRLYASSAVFVSPSWTEGCQLPPMEAMACRTAVVATNVGGIPDYAIAGETALVVQPHDVEALAGAIIRLLQNEALRRQVAEAGFRQIQRFQWDEAVTRFETALAEGIATSNR